MSEHHHHDCHCNHEHHSHFGHTHNHTVDAKLQGIFYICIALNLIYVIVESGMGWLYGSLSLLSDAGHTLGDVFSLLNSVFPRTVVGCSLEQRSGVPSNSDWVFPRTVVRCSLEQ